MREFVEALKKKKLVRFQFSKEELEVLALIDHHQWQEVLKTDRCLLEHLYYRLWHYRQREMGEVEVLLEALESIPPCHDDEDFV